jgi:glycosyltransferase involved in cell wall biosynthesis
MRIVVAHKFAHVVGGAEEYIRQQRNVMERHGHEVIPFAQRDLAQPSAFDRYFLEPLELRSSHWGYKVANAGRIVARTLYSLEARRRIGALVRDLAPDVAHLHAIENHISPSILHELVRRGVPIVQSVNNYKQVCASFRLYLQDRGQVCERCAPGRYLPVLATRCVKGSLPASLLATLEMYLHQSLLHIYRHVDRFVVPNAFVAGRLLRAGHAPQKVVTLRNPFDLRESPPADGAGEHVLFFGRIEPEKGLPTLLRAMARVRSQRLVVVGDGTQAAACRALARQAGLGNVEFVGPRWGADLVPYLHGCRCVVVPSLWFEPSPYVVYQALAAARPVVAADIGGLPDLLTAETGILFPPGDDAALAEALATLGGDAARARAMGRAARRWAEVHLDVQAYYEGIMAVYGALLDGRGPRPGAGRRAAAG